MKIDPAEWIPLKDAVAASGLPRSTAYLRAKQLGIAVVVLGQTCIRRDDEPRLQAAIRPRGNPRWIESGAAAAADATAGAESKKRRKRRKKSQ